MESSKAELIPKAFDSKSQEEKMYKLWEDSGYFKPENVKEYLEKSNKEIKKPFVMTLPPPNANGDLHMGHTCGYSFHDAMARFNRMTGHPTLLIAGKDHAGIQTESVYTKILRSEGIDKWDLGRDEFNKRCYEFCLNASNNARSQEKRIGLSTDWDREFFTLDPRLTSVVYDTFFRMLNDGLIYRDKRIINQCPNCRTALADIDTYHKELPGIFAYIVYPFVEEEDKKRAKDKFGVEGITVATTRPETMLGDTAVAVSPKDDRYKEFVGKKVLLPIANREIPIITDDDIDIETGTGALKVTPAHSPVDFEIAKRNNLEIINVINEEGKMSGNIPERFLGMDTLECSKALVKELDELGLFVKLERIKHEVAVCERCDTPIQPIISFQWYVNTKPLAQKALEALKKGDTKVIPDGQQKALTYFFENIEPWCISRQLWWGHRIPIWYSGSKELHDWLADNPGKTTQDFEKEVGKEAHGSGKVFASVEKPEVDPDWENEKNLEFESESDVFDTWFSSGQWPFSTTMSINGFDEYYPTDVMVHGRDILFWWSARMMMLSLYRTGKTPFHTVFLHGIINAPDGSKMSKSKGNTVSPIELFDRYGVDSLRLWYYSDALPGANAPLREEKIKGNRNFINKIWNASRFVLMNIDDSEILEISKRLAEGNIKSERVTQSNAHIARVKRYLGKHQYNLGTEDIREFFWHEYCDKWIEEVKGAIKDEKVNSEKRIELLSELVYLLKENLKIMHPFIPYITESVWQELVGLGLADGILMIEQI
ncbi:valine--tRNA ligase [Candidatus Dojkabacteria bacterium]|nr:valine--tRNA ligase [Candidatus Dojkabacteria bacterium]